MLIMNYSKAVVFRQKLSHVKMKKKVQKKVRKRGN